MKPRKSSLQIASALMALYATPSVFADTLTWDAGVDSNWNTTTANWTGDTWDNTVPDDAIFGVIGEGTVTATEAITAGSVTFTGGAYSFASSGGGSLSFTTLDTTGATSVGFNGVLAGNGTITSNVSTNWNGNNSAYNGIVNNSAGNLAFDNANALGTGTINLSGGALLATQTFNLNSSLIINATGGTIAQATANRQFGILGTVNFNTGGTGVTLGGQLENRTLHFRNGSTIGGDAANVTISRSSVTIDSGVTINYGGSFTLTGTTQTAGHFSLLNLGDGIDLSSTGSKNTIILSDVFNSQKIVQAAANGTATVGDIVLQEGVAGQMSLTAGTGGTLNVNGVISQSTAGRTLNIYGAGTVVLNNTNTYSGATTITSGTLLVNGTNSGTGAVNVDAGATLGGTGSISGAINVTGQLAPGSSIESLSGAALSFLDTSTFAVEVDSSVSLGAGADLMVVNGNLNLAGTVNLTLANIATSPVVFGDNTTFSLINYTGIWNDGLFTYGADILDDGDTFAFNGQTWQIDYNSTLGGSNFTGDHLSGSFVNITAIPEPGTAGLLAGLLVLTTLVRRRRAQ